MKEKQVIEKTIGGLRWSLLYQIAQITSKFTIAVLLARLLGPEAFGLIGMVTVFSGFAGLLSGFGFGQALVHFRIKDQATYSTVFWTNLLIGTCIAVVFMAAANSIVAFFQNQEIRELIYAFSLNFILTASGSVHLAILKQRLEFEQISTSAIFSLVLSGISALVCAFAGLGVWSLVVRDLTLALSNSCAYWYYSKWIPSFAFNLRKVSQLFSYGRHLIGFNIVNYWSRRADNLLIARFLGAIELGLYSQAYAFMLFPLRNITRVLSRVMFPAFSALQENKKKIANIYLKMTGAISLIAFPMMAGFFVIADEFVAFALTQKWVRLTPVLQLFCIVGAVQAIGTLNGNIYQALGQTKLQFRVGLVISTAAIAAIAIGLQWGIEGVAAAYMIFSLLATYPSISIAIRLIDLRFSDVVKSVLPAILLSIGMGISVAGIKSFLPADIDAPFRLMTLTVAGCITYWALAYVFGVESYFHFVNTLRTRLFPRFGISKG